MDSIRQFWFEVMQMKEARWIVAVFGLVTCVLVAVYFVKLFRDMAMGKDNESVSDLVDFQRLHEEGKLDGDEYNKLKIAIPKSLMSAAQLEAQSKKSQVGDPKFIELKDNE